MAGSMIGVADCYRQCIGGIRASELHAGQQHAEHRLDLFFRSRAGADDGFFDQARGIFGHGKPAACAAEQHHAARVGKLEG